jgi:mRNA-degrading endonuclease RelE of RelBE toxin-antitoxin system
MKVNLATQVVEYVGSRAPQPRRRLRKALRELEAEKGDIKPLQGQLDAYCRLRVGPYRVVFAYRVSGTSREIDVLFCEHRSLVYEAFTVLAAQLHG